MNDTPLTKYQHRKHAEELLQQAEKMLADKDYVQLRGYGEINVVLAMADLHERLGRRNDMRTM